MVGFAWDERKARRNLREHGISFPVAQVAMESGLAVELAEQFREGEWRTVIAAPIHAVLLLIVVAIYDGEDDEEGEYNPAESEEGSSDERDTIIRIISARHASKQESQLYIEARAAKDG